MHDVLVGTGLVLQQREDGFWLHFNGSKGRVALINIDNMAAGIITKAALKEWAEEIMKRDAEKTAKKN